MLGLRSSIKPDIKASAAEMVFGTTLRLPGEFFIEQKASLKQTEFVEKLRQRMNELRPTPTSNHSTQKFFIQNELKSCTHVFVRDDSVRLSLQPPYKGPYEVVKRNEKYFHLRIKDKIVKISKQLSYGPMKTTSIAQQRNRTSRRLLSQNKRLQDMDVS